MVDDFKTGGYCAGCLKASGQCTCFQKFGASKVLTDDEVLDLVLKKPPGPEPLTEDESLELDILISLQQNHSRPFTQEEFERVNYLKKKHLSNLDWLGVCNQCHSPLVCRAEFIAERCDECLNE